MTEENTVSEATQTNCCVDIGEEVPQAPMTRQKPERTIFRFKGVEDMAIDLGKLYKIVYHEGGKTVLLQTSPKKDDLADAIEFESEDAALRGYEQIIGIWARGS